MAGKIISTTHQINDSATATNNFVLKADNLGGLKLSRGNDGATSQDIFTVDSSGVMNSNVGFTNQILHVRDEKAASSQGGSSSVGDQVRVLNTVVTNTITGASLGSNQITLPAGKYKVSGSAIACASDGHRARLVNVTDSTVTLLGDTQHSGAADNTNTASRIEGIFTIAATKVFNVTHYITSARAAYGFGYGVADSQVAIFTSIFIEKIG